MPIIISNTGHILTIETVDMKYSEGFKWQGIDPDKCSWVEKASVYKLYLSVMRIFFVNGPPEKAEIGLYC